MMRNLLRVLFVCLLSFIELATYAQTTYYSANGATTPLWTSTSTWTTSPTGGGFPGIGIPTSGPGSITGGTGLGTDNVVILNGHTVFLDYDAVNIRTLGTVEIRAGGTLIIRGNGASTQIVINTLQGSGTLRVNGVVTGAYILPTVTNADNFVATTGGTIDFFGTTSATLPVADLFGDTSADNYYNLTLSGTVAHNKTLAGNLTVSGNLTVDSSATFVIGNSNTARTINLTGNLIIGAGSNATNSITCTDLAGGQTVIHQLNIAGNFVHNGTSTARFTTMAAQSNVASPTNDAHVLVVANNTAADQSFVMNGPTVFWRVQLTKGIDRTYILNLDASSEANFRILGPTIQITATGTLDAQVLLGTVDNTLQLEVSSGTLRIGSNILMDGAGGRSYFFTEGNEYRFDRDAGLWLDGGTIAFLDNGIYNFGYLRLSAGSYTMTGADDDAGIRFSDDSQVLVEGGTHQVHQIRTSNAVGSGFASWTMTGGTINIVDGGAGAPSGTQGIFGFRFAASVFQMSGGVVNINTQSGFATGSAIDIQSGAGNFSVTGGTFNINIPAGSASTFSINSTAPLWNLNVTRGGAGATTGTVTLVGNGLTVQNDLTITNPTSTTTTAVFNNSVNNLALTIGRNLDLGQNAAVATDILNMGTGTLSFTGTNRSRVYNRATGDTQVPTFAALTINKDTDTARVEFLTPNRAVNATADFNMTGLLTLTRGTFDYGSQLFSTTGNVTVGASTASAMGPASGSTGRLILAGTAAQTITQPYGSLTTWGNLEINNSFGTAPQVTLSTGDITSMQNLTMTLGIFDLGINGLRLENEVTLSGAAFSATKHIRMSGLASDGGLAIFKNAIDASILYPIGTNANATNRYLPVTLNLSAITGSGYIQVSMADVVLATLNGATTANTLSLYWRVRTTSGITAATGSYTMQGIASDFPGGAIPGAGYASGYTVSAARNLLVNVATDAVDGAGLITYSSHTLPSDGNYTTADANAIFTGTAKIYYSRGGGAMDWTTAATWTSNQVCVDCTIPNVHDSAINPQDGGIPGAGDIVVIGYDPTPSNNPAKIFYQGVAGTISAAELQFTPIPAPVIVGTDDWGDRPFFQIRNATTPTAAFGKVSGQGIFAIGIYNGTNGPTLTGIDFGDFNDTDGSVFLIQAMDNGAFTNVHSYPAGTTGGPTTFPDLRTYSGAYDDATIEFTSNLTVNYDMQVSGGARIRMNNGANGNFTIARDLRLYSPEPANWPLYTGAAIFFQATGTARTISVGRDILFETSGATQDSSQIFVDSTTVGTTVHTLNVGRNITQTSTNSKGLTLWSANTNRASVDLVLNTTQNGVISRVAGGISQKPKLGRLTLNKGTSIATTATVSTVFTLNGTTNTASKALTLTNGLLILNPSATNALVLSSDGAIGAADFTIPATAGLLLQNNVNATVTNATAANASGIVLNGYLATRGNSTLTMSGIIGSTVSCIIYGGNGSAVLDFGGGAVTIDGQIRRSATSIASGLKYRQSAGTVSLGGNLNAAAARTNQADDRGVFDLENNVGSSFTMSGGTLAITRRRNGTTPEFYLYAPNDTITGGTIAIGNASTPNTNNTIRIQTDKTLPALTVVEGIGTDGANNGTVAQVQVENLAISGDLTIENDTRFDPNSKNVTVQGNLAVNGNADYNFTATTHALTMSGTSPTAQSIVVPTTATATFSSLTINKTNATGGVNFTGGTATSLTVANDLTITDGTLNINGTVTTLNVGGNIINSDSTAGAGYIVTTKAATPIPTIGGSGAGRFTNLRIGNAIGAQFTANQRVVGDLNLTSGILDLGTNRLDLTSAATVTGTFSTTRHISTTGTLLAAGIRKLVAVGQADFTIPVGAGGFYTPFRYDNAGSTETTGGFLQVRPINSINLTTTNPGNNDVLNFYWNITPGGSIAFSALRFDFGAASTQAVDLGLNLYRTGYIFSGAGSWLKGNAPTYGTFPNNGVEQDVEVDGSAAVGRVRFSFGSTVNAGLTTSMSSTTPHDFTAGDGTVGTGKLESVVTYYSMAPGNFEDNTPGQWSTTSHAGPGCGTCGPSLASPELGGASSVRINHAITFSSNNDAAFDLTFTSAAGSINVVDFNGFNLGKVSGPGRVTMQPTGTSANLPDGDYTDFITTTGGTFEFGGTGNYTLPSSVSLATMNNVVVSGASGTKSLAAGTTTILGSLTVGETGAPTLVLGSNSLNLAGNLTHTAGTLTATGSTITLNGTTVQTIDALNVGGTTLNNLTVNNSAGVNIGAATTDSVMVNGTLTFTSGLVNTGGVRGILRLGTASSISPAATALTTSFVNGPIQKKIFTGGSFTFPTGESPSGFVVYRPIGIQNTSGGRVWTAEFNGSAHPNAANNTAPLVSNGSAREWWSVSDDLGAGLTNAQVTLYWGTGSNITDPPAVLSNFRVAKLNGTNWEVVTSSAPVGTIASGSVTTSVNTSFSQQFFALGAETTPLPVTWLSFTGRFVGKHADLNWITSQEINNERFEVERSLDGSNFAQVGILPGAGTISYPQYYGYTDFDAPIINKLYYRLRQIDFDGQSGYSPTIELARQGSEATVRYWTLYPNPTSGDNFSVVRISADVNLEDTHTLQVVDLYGNLMASHTGTLEAANQGLRTTVNSLQPGLYLIQISSNGKLQSERLIKK